MANPLLRALGFSDYKRAVETVVPRRTFADVILPAADAPRHRSGAGRRSRATSSSSGRWGLGERHPTGLALAFNFAGPPGTGKTICAEAIAHALGRPLLVVRYAEVASMWMGETPKNVVGVFRLARERNAVLLFDEADAIASRRSTSVRPGVAAREQRRRQRAAPGARVVQRRGDLRDQHGRELRSGVRAAHSHARAVRDARRRGARADLGSADAPDADAAAPTMSIFAALPNATRRAAATFETPCSRRL